MTFRRLVLLLVLLALALAAAPSTASAVPGPDCSAPTISGSTRVGNTLTAHPGACSSLASVSYSWSWYRCATANGTGCSGPVGTSGSYVLKDPGDRGSYMLLRQTASNGLGTDVDDTVSGRVKGHPPTARFTLSPGVVKRGQTVHFDGTTSTDSDGQPLQYRWDFNGDGSFDASGSTATTTYSTPGIKTVRLKVTDTDGDSSTTSHTVRVKGPPGASFVFSPGSPLTGDDVTFTSTSTDPDGDPLSYAWDIDGNGVYDNGSTPVIHATYSRPGAYTAGLRVTADGETSTFFTSVDVQPNPAPPPGKRLKLLRPFPRVAIGGFITGSGVRLTLLGVRAPRKSSVMVRCYGHGCPRRTTRRRVGRSGALVLRSFRRRFRAGTVIKVYVWKKNRIGKYTRFRIRRGKAPSRRDRCLNPTNLRPMRCPRR